jgi:predicted metal-dependent HD superfamily phosphohydrolase
MTPALEAAYAEPHRRYHTRAHIEDCLAELAAAPELTEPERRLLCWAIWWHDAIYDPSRADNEDLSAAMAERELVSLGVDASDRSEVARLIRLTRGHTVEPGDRIGAILVSIDLSILGRAPDVYHRYALAIREEYGFVPDELFRAGRARVLKHFLEAEAIFPDPIFRSRLEAPARANLARELAALETAAKSPRP